MFVTNVILLSSFFGLCVDCKNMQGVGNMKFVYKRVQNTGTMKLSTCSFHLDISRLLSSSGNRVPLRRWLVITFYKQQNTCANFTKIHPEPGLTSIMDVTHAWNFTVKMNPASCVVSRSLQIMFDLTFMIILMTKFNKVSHITFLPYKFRQGLRSNWFLIFHRSQKWWSESSVGGYFLQHSSDHSCIFQNIFVEYT